MKKIIFRFTLTLVIFISFIKCNIDTYEENPLKSIHVEKMYNYSFEENIEIQTKYRAINLVSEIIEIKDENIDYWQLPEETFNLKTGDCEDYSLLLCYLLETKLNIRTNLILLGRGNERHIIVQCENEYIDAVQGVTFKEIPNDWYIIYTILYEEAIWMTYYYHNNVGKYY